MRSHVISTHFVLSVFCLLALLLTACGQNATSSQGGTTNSTATPTATPALDAYGTPITYPATAPQRIVSLVPSDSEILGALHLESRVVGVDYYTDYPAALAALPKISDANGKYSIEQIVQLRPDLVLSYDQYTKQYDEQLSALGIHVVDLPLANLSQMLQDVLLVGKLTFVQGTAQTVVNQLQQQINQVKAAVVGTVAPKTMLEADDCTPGKPYIFGGGSFGDELLQDANAVNIFHDNTANQGFAQVTDEAIITANPEYVILTENPTYCGGVDSVYKRPNWDSIDAVKMHNVYLINTNLMQRPGPRLVEGLQCVAQLIHPDKFSAPLPAYCSASV